MASITVRATNDTDEARVEAAPGDEVTVRLPESPTTGYSWEPPEGHEVIASDFSPAGGDVAGAGGERVVTLIVGDGPADATFRLVRPWLPGDPARTFTIRWAPPG